MQKNFLVSGGSGGIGSALCMALAEEGYRPVIGYGVNEARALEIAKRAGGFALHLDMGKPDSIEAAVEVLANDEVPLAGVVMAASPMPVITPFGKIEPADMALQWRVNVEGPQQLLAGLVRRCLRKQNAGIVIAVLTEAMGDESHPPARGMGAYVIAKFGLWGLMRVLAGEYPWLSTEVVRPGFTETAMLEAFDSRFLDNMRAARPNGGFATPGEVAETIMARIMALQSTASEEV